MSFHNFSGIRFPQTRMRRLRKNAVIRELVSETELNTNDFIYPLFVDETIEKRKPIKAMPGIERLSLGEVVREVEEALSLGIKAFILFGIPKEKDEIASQAYAENGIVQRAVSKLKAKFGDSAVIITDVCMCEYMSHGHCGIIKNKTVDNDATLELLAKTALSHAKAGADIVAPSDMMDGRIAAIRKALDENGFKDTIIMSYAAKYASSFYGPFREAAESAPAFGDRRSYQMHIANANEALREVYLDIVEGADIVMVKPALAYLDVIKAVKETFAMPTAAYNVSGEYSLVKAASEKGFVDEKRITLEILTSIKRAGADLILTYHAKEAAKWLEENTQ